MTLSEKIVDYVISLNKKEIPEMVYLKAQEHFQDTVACIMAGAGKGFYDLWCSGIYSA